MSRWPLGALIAGLMFMLFPAAPAQAEWLTVTNCEMVTIDGHEYGKLTFDLRNPDQGGIDYISLRPKEGDSGRILSTTLPEHWVQNTVGLPEDGLLSWQTTSFQYAVPPGGTLSGIQIVLSEPVACYALRFPGPLLGDPYPEWSVCFACPGVTPAGESTWGRVKQAYR